MNRYNGTKPRKWRPVRRMSGYEKCRSLTATMTAGTMASEEPSLTSVVSFVVKESTPSLEPGIVLAGFAGVSSPRPLWTQSAMLTMLKLPATSMALGR